MFSSPNFALIASSLTEEATQPRNIPPPTPIVFPRCTPPISQPHVSKPKLVSYLQKLVRPNDLSIEHLQALNLQVNHDVPLESFLPGASFLPPREKWTSIPASDLAAINEETKRPLSNGTKSPGAQTYIERLGELSIQNEAAFRTIRRVPATHGQPLVRLGNAYDFFKNLELVANYWDDTSISASEPEVLDAMEIETDAKIKSEKIEKSRKQTRTGAGASMPNDVRQNLLISFVKLVSYDFGCNVTIPRLEPRLHLKSQGPNPMHSYFPSTPIFIYRTPISRQDARAGIVEGPLVALSPRSMTSFPNRTIKSDVTAEGLSQSNPLPPSSEEVADLSREIINILTTAQIRSREHQTEVRYGNGKWWTTKPRWGGGIGGPIGREIKEPEQETEKEKSRELEIANIVMHLRGAVAPAESTPTATAPPVVISPLSKTSDSGGMEKPERKKQKIRKKAGGQMEIYDAYRMVRPPATNWDQKSRYMALGKDPNCPFDEIFLISALYHHISVVRARVSTAFMEALEGKGKFMCEEDEDEEGRLVIWRSKWFDLFKAEDRIEGMGLIWGVMGYLLRGDEEKATVDGNETSNK